MMIMTNALDKTKMRRKSKQTNKRSMRVNMCELGSLKDRVESLSEIPKQLYVGEKL